MEVYLSLSPLPSEGCTTSDELRRWNPRPELSARTPCVQQNNGVPNVAGCAPKSSGSYRNAGLVVNRRAGVRIPAIANTVPVDREQSERSDASAFRMPLR